jgi:bifunctional non-homologous end joining protein LigD
LELPVVEKPAPHRFSTLNGRHRERTYRAGRSDHWIKVKNRKHPAFSRVNDQF